MTKPPVKRQRLPKRHPLSFAAALAAIAASSEANAAEPCSGLGGLATVPAALIATPVTLVVSLGAPAIAVAVEPRLNYGAGVGYAFAAAVPGSSVGLLTEVFAICDAYYLPSLSAVVSGIAGTAAWAASSDWRPESAGALSHWAVQLTPVGDGGVALVGARF